MSQHKEDKMRLLLKCGMVFFSLTLLLSLILFVVNRWEKHFGTQSDGNEPTGATMTYDGQEYVLKEQVETLLVLGLDTFDNADSQSHRNNKQADFLMLLVLDKQNDSCKAIQINRDTMAQMDVLGVTGEKIDTTTAQLALAHTYGNGREVSCRNTAEAVSQLLGVNIQHYVSVSMDAVKEYTDLVGGVPVEIMDDFTALDPTMVKGKTVTLNGDQALTYVRTRKGLDDPTNQHRMERQKQYLQALLQVTDQRMQEDDGFVTSALDEIKDTWVSDRSAKDLKNLMTRFRVMEPETFYTIEGRTEMGEQFLEFYPEEKSLLRIVAECFYEPV